MTRHMFTAALASFFRPKGYVHLLQSWQKETMISASFEVVCVRTQ